MVVVTASVRKFGTLDSYFGLRLWTQACQSFILLLFWKRSAVPDTIRSNDFITLSHFCVTQPVQWSEGLDR